MILGGCFADLVASLRCELEVVGLLGMTEDDAIEALVISKRGESENPRPAAYIFAMAAKLSVGRATRIVEPGFTAVVPTLVVA